MRQLSRTRPPRPYIQSAPYRLQHKKKRRSDAAFFCGCRAAQSSPASCMMKRSTYQSIRATEANRCRAAPAGRSVG